MSSSPNESLLRIHKLQVLYDNEINANIGWFFDGGFQWALGDEVNGIVAKGKTYTAEEAIECLWGAALFHLLTDEKEVLREKLLRDLYAPFQVK